MPVCTPKAGPAASPDCQKIRPPPWMDEKQVRKILEAADVNRDGYLSWSELQKAFKKLGSRLPPYRAWRGLKNADANGDGLISLTERDSLVRYIMDWYNRHAQL